jgi:hypothetical protein
MRKYFARIATVTAFAAVTFIGITVNSGHAEEETMTLHPSANLITGETPVSYASPLMWRVNSNGGQILILGPGMNQVLFIGDDCNNSVDLKEGFGDDNGNVRNISYTYSDGPSLHSGETSNPDEAGEFDNVCWVVMST